MFDSTLHLDNRISALNLLVFQPTSYCNLSCKYCYLSFTNKRLTISEDVILRTLQRVEEEGIASGAFQISWHAGEPMVMGHKFYERIFGLIREKHPHLSIVHSMQSNGTLIDEAWCQLLKEHKVELGLSVDGPPRIHDINRVDRRKQGSSKKVEQSIDLLHRHGVPFHIISVVTNESLDNYAEVIDYLFSLGPDTIAFNCVEIEGKNKAGFELHAIDEVEKKYAKFLKYAFEKAYSLERPRMLREFEQVISALPALQKSASSGSLIATGIFYNLIVATNGDFTTFSPELLDVESGKFVFGNVLRDSLKGILDSSRFKKINEEIARGVYQCKVSCGYYNACFGGSVSNKYAEHGSMDVSETAFCRLSKKVPIEVGLEFMTSKLCESIA